MLHHYCYGWLCSPFTMPLCYLSLERSTWRSSSRRPRRQQKQRWPGRGGSLRNLVQQRGLGQQQRKRMKTLWLPGSASRRQRQLVRRPSKQPLHQQLRKGRCLGSLAMQQQWRQ